MSVKAEISEIKKITYVACNNWFSLPMEIELDGPFFSGWAMAIDEEPWFASCGKWETVGLLCTATIVALKTWTNDRSDSTVLVDAIACSERAVEELEEWRQKGNLETFGSGQLPEQATPEFFRVSRELSVVLYGISCLSRAGTPEEICDRNFAKIVLSAVVRAEELLSRVGNMSDGEHELPEALEDMVQEAMVATIVSVAMTYYTCAEKIRVLEPPRTVGWNDVVLFLEKGLECAKNTGCFEGEMWEMLETELNDNFKCALRLDQGFIGEWEVKEKLLPKSMPIQEKMPFPFSQAIS